MKLPGQDHQKKLRDCDQVCELEGAKPAMSSQCTLAAAHTHTNVFARSKNFEAQNGY